jgi:hypothetical protein
VPISDLSQRNIIGQTSLTPCISFIYLLETKKRQMEALAQGYGSDSSNSSSEEADKIIESTSSINSNKSGTMTTATSTSNSMNNTNSLNLLVSNYSDDSSIDGNDDDQNANVTVKNNKNSSSNIDAENQKRRYSNDAKQSTNKKAKYNQLPSPRLCNIGKNGTDNAFDALILFPKDYINIERQKQQPQKQQKECQNDGKKNKNEKSSSNLLSAKLNSLYNNFYSNDNNINGAGSSSFAKHLKNQKEFGNPHLFPSIITHFGIDPLGSNCLNLDDTSIETGKETGTGKSTATASYHSHSRSKTFGRFEFVEKIVQKEEENRIRNANASSMH